MTEENIVPCRRGIEKSVEDERRITFDGEGYHFEISKDPSGTSDCPCGGELQTANFDAVRLYECEQCQAKFSVCVEGKKLVETEVKGVNASEVAKAAKEVISIIWDMVQEYGDPEQRGHDPFLARIGKPNKRLQPHRIYLQGRFDERVSRFERRFRAFESLLETVSRAEALDEGDKEFLLHAFPHLVIETPSSDETGSKVMRIRESNSDARLTML